MRFLHVFYVVALWAKLAGGSATAAEANRFECSGEAQVAILHRSLDTGTAALKVTNLGLGGDSAEFDLDRVTLRQDMMGLMACGYYRGIADASLSFTLIVPTVIIADDEPVAGVEGMLIRSFAGLMPPPANTPVSGPRQKLQFSPVTCIASLRRSPH
jgi:hypothetical protein